jgi:hypothetical protein
LVIKIKLEQNQGTFVPFKRTKIGEDREEILFGIQVLDSLDANDIVHHDNTTIQEPYLGSIWFYHPDHGFVRLSLRLSKFGTIWKTHPKHGLLQQSARLAALSA